MPDFKVHGRSVIFWEAVIEADDADSAEEMTKDLIADALTVEFDLDPSVSAKVTSQEDKILRVLGVQHSYSSPKGPPS